MRMFKLTMMSEGCELLDVGKENDSENVKIIGGVTSGTFSPFLKAPIAMGYVSTAKAKVRERLKLLNKDVFSSLEQNCMQEFIRSFNQPKLLKCRLFQHLIIMEHDLKYIL